MDSNTSISRRDALKLEPPPPPARGSPLPGPRAA